MTCDLCERGGPVYQLTRACCAIRWIRAEPIPERRRGAMNWIRRNNAGIADVVERGVVDVLA